MILLQLGGCCAPKNFTGEVDRLPRPDDRLNIFFYDTFREPKTTRKKMGILSILPRIAIQSNPYIAKTGVKRTVPIIIDVL